MSSEKKWKLMALICSFLENLQKKAVTLAHPAQSPNFYRKYRNTSLAILNNFQSLSQALLVSKEYEVPLVHLTVGSPEEEQFVWKFILNCFENSQLLNQGFILWPEFLKGCATLVSDQTEEDRKTAQARRNVHENVPHPHGKIQCYCNDQMYKMILVKDLPACQEEVYQILDGLRKQYYELVNYYQGDVLEVRAAPAIARNRRENDGNQGQKNNEEKIVVPNEEVDVKNSQNQAPVNEQFEGFKSQDANQKDIKQAKLQKKPEM